MIEHSSSSNRLTVDAVVLAGGSARRMGGVDKPSLTVGRISLVQRAIDAVSTADRIVVVGPHRDELAHDIVQTRESPTGTGPVAAIAAGLHALSDRKSDIVLILASDLPFVDKRAVDILLSELKSTSAVFAADKSGRTQFLLGAWLGNTLRRQIASLTDPANLSVRSIVPEDHVVIEIDGVDDCDTPADLARARTSEAQARPDSAVPSVDRARDLIRNRIGPMPTRTVAPALGLGSTLSAPLVAAQPLPPVDVSAMDGFAVHGPGPWTVRTDVAYAGTSGHDELAPGDAVRIATGAQVPSGATKVIRDEHVVRDGDVLSRPDGADASDDTRRAGEDWPLGSELVSAGTPVSAAVVSVALSSEVAELTVRGPVRARIVISGNEIRSTGTLEPGQTRDSLGAVLPNYLSLCDIHSEDIEYLTDSPTAFADLLARPAGVEIVVIVGATGHGVADRLRTALVEADADMVVGRTSVRPGGSQITAVLSNGTVVLGLPGNPLAAVATVMLTAPAIVDALTARRVRPPALGVLTDDGYVDSPVSRVLPVRRDGALWAVHPTARTAHLLGLVDQDALALIPAGVTPGAPVELLLLR